MRDSLCFGSHLNRWAAYCVAALLVSIPGAGAAATASEGIDSRLMSAQSVALVPAQTNIAERASLLKGMLANSHILQYVRTQQPMATKPSDRQRSSSPQLGSLLLSPSQRKASIELTAGLTPIISASVPSVQRVALDRVLMRDNGTLRAVWLSIPVTGPVDELLAELVLPMLGLVGKGHQFERVSTVVDPVGDRHIKFQHEVSGLSVSGSQLVLHLNPAGALKMVTASLVQVDLTRPLIPSLTADEAEGAVRHYLATSNDAKHILTSPRLELFADLWQGASLAWAVNVSTGPYETWDVYIDALTGEESGRRAKTFDTRQSTTANDAHGQNRPLELWLRDGFYYTIDSSKPMFDAGAGDVLIGLADTGAIYVLQYNESDGGFYYIRSTNPNAAWPPDAVSAQNAISGFYDELLNDYQYNSFDGLGGSIISVIGFPDNNAYFDSTNSLMVFGNQDDYASALDVIAHEIAHGITSATSQLEYYLESGALNESFSDVMGEAFDFNQRGVNNWLIGDQLSQPIRSMANPEGFGDPSRYSAYDSTSQDNGGVHTNSSIINHAFYLMVNSSLDGLAITRSEASKIFFDANQQYLVRRSDFVDARIAVVAAANSRYGSSSAKVDRVRAAFDAIDLFDTAQNADSFRVQTLSGTEALLFSFITPSNGIPDIARLEFPEDEPAGSFVLFNEYAGSTPAAVDRQGILLAIVSADGQICFQTTLASEPEECVGDPGTFHSVAISPNGDRFAFLFKNANGQPDNSIYVGFQDGRDVLRIPMVNPVADGNGQEQVLLGDAMSFDATGSILFYDALVDVNTQSGGFEPVWSIFGHRIDAGATFGIFAPTEGLNVAYPSTSNTSTRYLTFDVQDRASDANTTFVLDLANGEFEPLASSQGYSTPRFSASDGRVLFSMVDGGTVSGSSIYDQSVSGLSTLGARQLVLEDAYFPAPYQRDSYVEAVAIDLRTQLSIASNGSFQIGLADQFQQPTTNLRVVLSGPVGSTLRSSTAGCANGQGVLVCEFANFDGLPLTVIGTVDRSGDYVASAAADDRDIYFADNFSRKSFTAPQATPTPMPTPTPTAMPTPKPTATTAPTSAGGGGGGSLGWLGMIFLAAARSFTLRAAFQRAF